MISQEKANIFSKILKSISHPTRLMIVTFLEDGSKSFNEICSQFDFDKSTLSKHLSVLKNAGLVSSVKSGHDMIYTLDIPCILDIMGCVTQVVNKNIEKQQKCLCN